MISSLMSVNSSISPCRLTRESYLSYFTLQISNKHVTTIRGIYSSTGAVIHVKVCGEPWLCRVSPSLCACHARCKFMVPTAKETHVEGVLVVQGVRFDDNRGFFKELYNERDFPPQVRIDRFRQVTITILSMFTV